MILLPDEQFLTEAHTIIKSASKAIAISTFKAEITTKPRGRKLYAFFETLFEKARAGVQIRFLLNSFDKRGFVPLSNLYAMKELPKQGIRLHKLPNERVVHAKLLIVDKAAAIFGSHNLSIKSCGSNFEISALVHDDGTIKDLLDIYDVVWQNSTEV